MKTLDKFLHPNLTEGKILPTLVSFSIPLMISIVFQQLYNAVDAMIVGNCLSEKSLAALGSCTAIFELLVGFGNGFGNGLSIVAARAFGAKDTEKLKKVVASSLFLTAIITIVIMLFSKLFLMKVLTFLGTPEEIKLESFSYINTITTYIAVLFVFNLLAGLLRAIGNSFTPLIFLVIASITNIFLDLLFIKNLNMGIKGAAIATVIAQLLSVIFCIIFIIKKTKILIPAKIHFHFEWKILKDLIGQGSSMALMFSIVSSGSVILQSAINSFGTFTIAGHISARKIFSITTIPLLTLSMAASTFVSQNLGAQKIDRIKKGIKLSFMITTLWTIILCSIMIFVIRPLLILVSGSQNEELLSYSTKYLYFCIPFFAVLGGLLVSRNSLQGLGSKLLPLISSIIELTGKILFTLLIIPRLGTWGIIMCEPLIWCFMFIQLIFVLVRHPVFRAKIEK